MIFTKGEIEILGLCALCKDLPVETGGISEQEAIEVLLLYGLLRKSRSGLSFRVSDKGYDYLQSLGFDFKRDKTYLGKSKAMYRRLETAKITKFFLKSGADVFKKEIVKEGMNNVFIPSFTFRRKSFSNPLGATQLCGFYYLRNTMFVPYYISKDNYRFGSLALAIAILLSSIMMNSFLVSGEDTPDIWDGTAVKPVLGSGTASDPYLIETPEHLAYVVESTKAEWGYYHSKRWFKLTNDIYLNDVSSADWYTKNNLKSWYAQDATFANNVGFSGALDGDGHTIYGLYWDSKSDSSNTVVGLFPKANTASEFVTIKNLGIDKA